MFSCRDGYLFWSDVLARVIACSRTDGTNVTVLVQTGVTIPGELNQFFNYHQCKYITKNKAHEGSDNKVYAKLDE